MPWYRVHGQAQQVLPENVADFLRQYPDAEAIQPPVWKPRASLLGAYMTCLYRAAADRAYHEELPGCWVPKPPEETMYADHGTICHWLSQVGVSAVFPQPKPPSTEHYQSAARLFASEAEQRDMASQAASLAVSVLPNLSSGAYWLAEEEWQLPELSGHTDLRASDFSWVVDFKFTALPPKNNRIKAEHLPQMAAYTAFVQPRHIRVIYVDFLKAAWAVTVDISCQTDDWRWYVDHVLEFARFCCGPDLFRAAIPHVGDHCGRLWCPYQTYCSMRVFPEAGNFIDVAHTKRRLQTFFAKMTRNSL